MEPWPPPPLPAGRIRRRWLVVAISVILAIPLVLPIAFIAWLELSAADPAPYLATIDSLDVPPSWEVVHTQAVRSFMGSRADRSYLVDAEPEQIAPVVEDVLRSAGLEIYDRVASSNWCDNRPPGATPAITCPRKSIPTCQANGSGGPVSCWVVGFRWLSMDSSLEKSILERVSVSVSPRGDVFNVGVGDQAQEIDGRNRVLVTVSVDRASARYFWSSPTPPPSQPTSSP